VSNATHSIEPRTPNPIPTAPTYCQAVFCECWYLQFYGVINATYSKNCESAAEDQLKKTVSGIYASPPLSDVQQTPKVLTNSANNAMQVNLAANEEMRKTIIFHIGLEKTGTTSFQKFSTLNRAKFLQHSVVYPTENYAFYKHNHGPLAACYLNEQETDLLITKSPYRSREDVLKSLKQEISKASADNVILSSEHFSSRFSSTQIQQLAADFSDYHCKIAVVVRDHNLRAISAYNTTIMSGRHLTLHEYIDELCNETNIYMRYKETISLWESAFGAENIIVLKYDECSNIVYDLVKKLISPDFKFMGNKSYTENRSLGASGIEIRRLINKRLSLHFQTEVSNFSYKDYIEIILYVVRKIILKTSPDRLQISENDLQRLGAIAEIDRQWLEKHYNVILTNL
jgi:hypothetical protein